MTNLNYFIKNSDYTAVKSLPQKYNATINIPAGSVSSGIQWTQNITVPTGQYTTMQLVGIDGQYSTPGFVLEIENNITIGGTFQRTSPTNVRMLVEVSTWGGGPANINAHTITGSFILQPAPI